MIGRKDYLLEVASRMWPPSAGMARTRSRTPGERAFVLIPSADRPHLMVPAGAPRAAAAAVDGFTGHRTGSAGLRSWLLRRALAIGAGEWLLPGRLVVGPEPGIEAHLATVLGETPLIAMHIGPPRANRKPVLQLLDHGGRLLGFAKIGTGPLTRELVDREAAALHRLAENRPAGIDVPRVLHHGRWRDLDVLVQSPLPVRGSRAPSPRSLVAAMVEVADGTVQQSVPLDGCGYLGALIAELHALGEAGTALARDLETVRSAGPERQVTLGAWHGDWTPWNCAAGVDGRLLVWDWERYQEGVPRGLDALHHHLQGGLGAGTVSVARATGLIEDAPRLLAPFGLGPDDARLTGVLYLAEIARRYLTDGQAAAGARRGEVGAWLVPAVHQQIPHLTRQRSR